jgi:putative holliday junction resolvase
VNGLQRIILGLDVGAARIGVAKVGEGPRIPQPVGVLTYSDAVVLGIAELCQQYQATDVVVGLPRNLDGNDTDQTQFVRDFVHDLEAAVTVPVHFQDEAGTTKKAEAELEQHKRRRPDPAVTVDSLAAVYILEDFIAQELDNA